MSSSSAIGGYFGLELNKSKEYHRSAIKLNTGRNALEYVLLARNYKKIYLPYYTCEALLQPVQRLALPYDFYHINEAFEPVFDMSMIEDNEAFLYTNYFGLKGDFIKSFGQTCRNLIVDNAQAFYCRPLPSVDTFYSPRKFFGIPDGAYLYTTAETKLELEKDVSYRRFEHLLRRIDISAEDGYNCFAINDKSLDNQNIKEMSNLTQGILDSIDYNEVAFRRRDNFEYLQHNLNEHNLLHFKLEENHVPMVYPFLPKKEGLRRDLMKNRVYTAQYWPNVLNWVDNQSLEYKYASELVHLPIDQRYSHKELSKVIELVRAYV